MSKPAGKVVIAGGSGFLGQALAASLLADGYEVVVLSRNNQRSLTGRLVKWDAQNLDSWSQQLEGVLIILSKSLGQDDFQTNYVKCFSIKPIQ